VTRPDGVKEKQVPHHALAQVQSRVVALGLAAFTKAALDGGWAMGLDSADMFHVIASLDRHGFYKSMTSYGNDSEWQDVYRARTQNNRIAYIKVILRPIKPVLQFKER
jgi:motility quorum-sensing regulator/GCU-specific mRNA interferase toxin